MAGIPRSGADAGGSSLFVERSGSGTPAVLVHSSGMSGRQWKRLASRLVERGLQAVVPDLTGHGRSPAWPEPEPFSHQVDVDRIVALLGSLDEPAHLVGHSYGGFIALLAALAAPSRVRSLAVYDPVSFGVLDPVADADARAELPAFGRDPDGPDPGHDRFLEMLVDYWNGKGGWRALRDDARAEFHRVGWVVSRGVQSLAVERTPASAYAVLQVPALLMTGERSTLAAHAVVKNLAGAIPGARAVTLAGAGHMGPLTHTDAVNDAIVEFLAAH
jgi:pimeloyl-ACP methyl ester carboxylesterase